MTQQRGDAGLSLRARRDLSILSTLFVWRLDGSGYHGVLGFTPSLGLAASAVFAKNKHTNALRDESSITTQAGPQNCTSSMASESVQSSTRLGTFVQETTSHLEKRLLYPNSRIPRVLLQVLSNSAFRMCARQIVLTFVCGEGVKLVLVHRILVDTECQRSVLVPRRRYLVFPEFHCLVDGSILIANCFDYDVRICKFGKPWLDKAHAVEDRKILDRDVFGEDVQRAPSPVEQRFYYRFSC